MPDIRICHTQQLGMPEQSQDDTDGVWKDIIAGIRLKSFELFLPAEPKLTIHDFSMYDEAVKGMSEQTHDVILRITVHEIAARVKDGPRIVQEITDAADALFNQEALVKKRGKVTIGVSLLAAQVAWADTTRHAKVSI